MEYELERSFLKDLEKLPNNIQDKAKELVYQKIPNFKQLSEIPHLEKVKKRKNAYRIRVGDYCLGFCYEDKIIFEQAKHRKDFYKFFSVIF